MTEQDTRINVTLKQPCATTNPKITTWSLHLQAIPPLLQWAGHLLNITWPSWITAQRHHYHLFMTLRVSLKRQGIQMELLFEVCTLSALSCVQMFLFYQPPFTNKNGPHEDLHTFTLLSYSSNTFRQKRHHWPLHSLKFSYFVAKIQIITLLCTCRALRSKFCILSLAWSGLLLWTTIKWCEGRSWSLGSTSAFPSWDSKWNSYLSIFLFMCYFCARHLRYFSFLWDMQTRGQALTCNGSPEYFVSVLETQNTPQLHNLIRVEQNTSCLGTLRICFIGLKLRDLWWF